ncbi:S1 RNA-binding domain-containing protein [Streptomyces albidoflavus]|uniref:S1 RNA-binding domain-containing protein n=1 Tax=Streptomyces albidoflavus TaxID=1886 RepID=UPI0020D0864A|nr:S1 RNA-binding domain-containing protein [Streptomyces albidoflavus]
MTASAPDPRLESLGDRAGGAGGNTGQIALSLKALQEDPLIRFADQAGLVLTGTVVRILPFAVLVRLAPDVVGLLHLFELGGGPSATPDQLVAEGELITVKVTEVDLERHRVRLCAVGRVAAPGPGPGPWTYPLPGRSSPSRSMIPQASPRGDANQCLAVRIVPIYR